MNNMMIEDYLAREELGSSSLKYILTNAKKYNLLRTGQIDIRTRAMDEGRIFHTMLLEPEKLEQTIYLGMPLSDKLAEIYKHIGSFDKIHVVNVNSKNQSEWQKLKKSIGGEVTEHECMVTNAENDLLQEHLQNKNKIFILQDRLNEIKKWAEKIKSLPHMPQLLEQGEKEQTFFGEINGVKVKCRVDLLFRRAENKVAIIDLKSMDGECTPDEFTNASKRDLYFLQESLYRWILMQNDLFVEEFNFAAASKTEWSGAGYFSHDEPTRLAGERFVERAIEKYKVCFEKNTWLESDFDFDSMKFDTVSKISIPVYMLNKYQSFEV